MILNNNKNLKATIAIYVQGKIKLKVNTENKKAINSSVATSILGSSFIS